MSTTEIARPLGPPAGRFEEPSPNARRSRPEVGRWIQWLPLPLLILTQVLMSLSLGNTAFEDEALYVQAGRDLLAHWQGEGPATDYASYFSGAPVAYPVLAGLLDAAGGLALVRAFSLACTVATMLCVRATTRHLFGRTAGDLAGFVFAVTGPVVFLGALATFDALCLLLLSVALWLGVTRTSWVTAVLTGAALAGAVVVKYTGVAFIPVVLAVMLLTVGRQSLRDDLLRVLVAGAVTAVLLGSLYASASEEIRAGIAFTTTGREALSPAPLSQLLNYVLLDIGLLAALALVGGCFLVRSLRSTLLLLALFAGASGLVLSQMYLGESVSFEKHMAYSALFLAPLAGRALAPLASGPLPRGRVLLVTLMGLLVLSGLARAHWLYSWPSVERAVQLVTAEDPEPGEYFTTQAQTLRYHTWEQHPELDWTSHRTVAGQDSEAVRELVQDGAFEMVMWSEDSDGAEDPQMEVFREAVLESPQYELVAEPYTVPAWGSEQDWYVFELKD